MSNIFKSLDFIFPCGAAERAFGEVVTTGIRVFVNNVDLGEIHMKRKAWYVNASVNAFHMHRALVRDLKELQLPKLPRKGDVKAKRLVALAVLNSYLAHAKSDVQEFQYNLHLNVADRDTSAALWWDYGMSNQWVEITDKYPATLESIVDISVLGFLRDYPEVVKDRKQGAKWELIPYDFKLNLV